MNYPIGDFLIRLKNASLAGRKSVVTDSSKLVKAVAQVLEKEGYLTDIVEKEGKLSVKLAFRKKSPILVDVVLISKPGLRVYMGKEDLDSIKGPSIFILSTSQGVLSGRQAVKKGLGGEVIAKIL